MRAAASAPARRLVPRPDGAAAAAVAADTEAAGVFDARDSRSFGRPLAAPAPAPAAAAAAAPPAARSLLPTGGDPSAPACASAVGVRGLGERPPADPGRGLADSDRLRLEAAKGHTPHRRQAGRQPDRQPDKQAGRWQPVSWAACEWYVKIPAATCTRTQEQRAVAPQSSEEAPPTKAPNPYATVEDMRRPKPLKTPAAGVPKDVHTRARSKP